MRTFKKTMVLILALSMLAGFAGLCQASGIKDLKDAAGSAGALLNINKASVTDLVDLPGMGKDLAEAIVKYRGANGSFGSVDDLLKVDGMDKDLFDKIKNLVTI